MEKQVSKNVLEQAVTIDNKVNQAVWNTLRTSVHPNASEESILTIIAYQKSIDVNPLTKCYHVVKYNSQQANGKWSSVEQIIPSITLYRIQASRSNLYSGISEPEFGPIVEKEFTTTNRDTKEVTKSKLAYPSWCKLKGYRLVNGNSSAIAEFNAFVVWEENYAKVDKKTGYPNYMWMNRPMGMIEKVCESQLLRKMFPEICEGYTYQELAGKIDEIVDVTLQSVVEVKPANVVNNNNITGKKPLTTSHEIELDGALLKTSDVPSLIKARINLSMHNGSLDEYEKWKEKNKASLISFSKNHPEETAAIFAHLNEAKAKLTKEVTLNEVEKLKPKERDVTAYLSAG